MAVKDIVETAIKENKIMIFSKTTWQKPMVIELNEREDGPAIQSYLAEKTGQRTVPNIFVNTQHVGGNDDTQAAFKSGGVDAFGERITL
ncbi:Glutaredoxin [Mycena sanguinolenta]|uniref:Glutaredoxin n=1 Tax=Mycena sanguinolenta TaxID=230812 RepID=A0A8H7DNQ5_9AGAR|nr:Glutaredoxin [Mycena sanguinolenta]